MAATKDHQPVKKEETKSHTWRIEGFSKREETTIYSDVFLAGGHKWRIVVYPKEEGIRTLSVYLELDDYNPEMRDRDSVLAHFTVIIVDQLIATSSVKLSTKHKFHKKSDAWGWKHLVGMSDLQNPRTGFLVNDTLVIKAEVFVEVAAAAAAAEAVANDDELKAIVADGQPKEAIKVPLTQQTFSQHEDEVHSPAKQSGATSRPFSSSDVQLNSRNLIAELSAMTQSFDGSSSPDPDNHGSDLLQQQWKKLDEFLGMSLEAISQAKSLDEVENTAIQIAKHATHPLQKTVLKDVASRVAEFKETIPSTLSTIETSHAIESSVAQMKKDMEVRLVHRKRQLSSLEAEVSRLGEEDLKLESLIQPLTARKAKITDHRNSTLAELGKASQEASKELEEFKKQCGESKQAVEDRMRAKERLAQSNASWKLFKAKLGR